MNPIRAVVVAFCFALGGGGSPVSPGPFDSRLIPSDARWVVHLDLEAARKSTCCTFLLQESSAARRLREQLSVFEDATGVNLWQDIDRATVFGVSYDPRDAVAIVLASPTIDEFIDRHRKEHRGPWSVIEHGDRAIHRFEEGDRVQYVSIFPCEEGAKRLIILTQDLGHLIRTVDRLDQREDGKSPSVEAGTGLNLDGARDGAILTGAALGMNRISGSTDRSATVQRIERLAFVFGEADGGVYFDLDLLADSPDGATHLVEMARSTAAWLTSLAGASSERAAHTLTSATTIGTDGREVTLRLYLREREMREVVAAVSRRFAESGVASRK